MVYGGVAADVGVFEAVAGEPAREQARYGRLDAVVLVPVNELVPEPEQCAVARALRVSGAVEEDYVVLPARLADGLAVYLGPLLGVAVVVALRVRAGEQHGVVGQSFTEVRHPARGAVTDKLVLYDILEPGARLRVRQVHEGGGEVGDLDPVGFAL